MNLIHSPWLLCLFGTFNCRELSCDQISLLYAKISGCQSISTIPVCKLKFSICKMKSLIYIAFFRFRSRFHFEKYDSIVSRHVCSPNGGS